MIGMAVESAIRIADSFQDLASRFDIQGTPNGVAFRRRHGTADRLRSKRQGSAQFQTLNVTGQIGDNPHPLSQLQRGGIAAGLVLIMMGGLLALPTGTSLLHLQTDAEHYDNTKELIAHSRYSLTKPMATPQLSRFGKF